jgi:hypothetical protein
MGRQTRQLDYKGSNSVFDKQTFYNTKGQVIEEDTSTTNASNDVNRRITRYDYGVGSNYALGQVVQSVTDGYKNGDDSSRLDNATKYFYQWYDGAVQTTIQHDKRYSNHYQHSIVGNGSARGMQQGANLNSYRGFDVDYTTTNTLNAFGQITYSRIRDGIARDVNFTLDETGQVFRRQESELSSSVSQSGAPVEVWYRYGGAEMGRTSNNGTSNVSTIDSINERTARPHHEDYTGTFRGGGNTGSTYIDASGFERLNSYNQGSGAGTYTVRGGENLQAIAASIYGDSNLWYKIASANGLSGNEALPAGRELRLPAGVVKSTHNANSFKPYDAGEAVGDLSPTTPKPSKSSKCGVFGQILLVAVAVAVTIATKGAFAKFAGSKILGGALAGAAGSVASQGLGVATGIQDKFSFKSVAMAAIGGGVGGALGEGGGLFEKGIFNGVKSTALKAGLTAATSSAITQGIGVATGLQSKFSFAGVAAAGVGAFAGAAFAKEVFGVSGSDFSSGFKGDVQQAVVGAADAIANAATRSAIEGSSFGDNLIAAIPDVIGNAIGRALGGAVVGAPKPKAVQTGTPLDAAIAHVESVGQDPTLLTTAQGRRDFEKLISDGRISPQNAALLVASSGNLQTLTGSLEQLGGTIEENSLVGVTGGTETTYNLAAGGEVELKKVGGQGIDLLYAADGAKEEITQILDETNAAEIALGVQILLGPIAVAKNVAIGFGVDAAFGEQIDTAKGFVADQIAAAALDTRAGQISDDALSDFESQIAPFDLDKAFARTDRINSLRDGARFLVDVAAELALGLATSRKKGEPLCFAAGTLVHTKSGLRPIESLSVGELVWSMSEHDVGQPGWRRISDHAVTGESEIFEVRLNNSSGEFQETIRTTSLHPFWVEDLNGPNAGKFVAVQDLRPGDKLRLANNSNVWVENVNSTGVIETVYNFTVEGWHTYYVGEAGVWVHNTNCIPKLNRFEKAQLRSINRQIRLGGMQGIRRPVSEQSFDALARNFVGPNFTRRLDDSGKFVIYKSDDGLRKVRSPVHKEQVNNDTLLQPLNTTNFVGNFESRTVASGGYPNNVHVSVDRALTGRNR